MERKVPGILQRQIAKMKTKKNDYNNVVVPMSDIVDSLDQADLVTSKVITPDGTIVGHAPVIDIDGINISLVPSTTPGNYHLYVDKVIQWGKYVKLLTALYEAGIIEYEYYTLAVNNGYTAVRLPWIKKEMSEEDKRVRAIRDKLKKDPQFPDSLLLDPDFSKKLREKVRAEIESEK